MACAEIFRRIEDQDQEKIRQVVTVSMLEIYNEHIYDLFQDPKYRSKEGLKIWEQKDQGIFVEGLSVFPV